MLLAQAAPSPTPTASELQTPTLTFADGLRRLINDGFNVVSQELVFAPDLGLRIGGTYNTYALKFAIAGFTDCQVTSNGYDAGDVACTAYKGPDAALARTTFSHLLKQLQDFAGSNSVSVIENPPHVGLHVGKETEAKYFPNGRVRVFINLLESRAKGFPSAASFVVAHVPANETWLTPLSSPTASTCPTTEVMRITTHGPVPSATPLPADHPPMAYASVVVTVSPDGTVMRAVLKHSTGSASEDGDALSAARTGTYKPKMADCKPVEGTYFFLEVFTIA